MNIKRSEIREIAELVSVAEMGLLRAVSLLDGLKNTLEIPFHPIRGTDIQDGWKSAGSAYRKLIKMADDIDKTNQQPAE
jgi:hypothetical protein